MYRNWFYLNSKANKDIYSQNDSYQFVNEFPINLYYPISPTPRVSLLEISFPLRFDDYDFTQIYNFLVKLDIVEDSLFGDKRINLLRHIQLAPSSEKHKLAKFEFKNLILADLRRNSIKRIEVSICDIEGNILVVKKDPQYLKEVPTILLCATTNQR